MVLSTLLGLWLLANGSMGPPTPSQPAVPTPLTPARPSVVEPQAKPLVLTLDVALRLGLERDRLVRIGRYDSQAARASLTSAYSVYQPQVSLQAEYQRQKARTSSTTGTVFDNSTQDVWFSVSQLIFDTAQGLYGIARAREEARAAAFQELETTLTSAKRIAADFYDAVKAKALVKLGEEVLARTQAEQEQAQARFSQGVAARIEITRAEVAVSNAKVSLAAATDSLHNALARVRYDLLLPPESPLDVNDSFVVPAVDVGLAEALTAAKTERPAIAATAATAKAKRHALTAARLTRWIRVNITGNYNVFVTSRAGTNNEYNLTAGLELPLWDGLAGKAAEDLATAAYRKAGEQARRQLEQASLEVEQTHLTWDDAVVKLAAAEDAARLAAASLSQGEESFRLGTTSQTELTLSRTDYTQAISNLIQAKVDRDLASINLRLAIGRFPLPPAPAKESAK